MASSAQEFSGPIIAAARITAQPGKADELAQWVANLKARAEKEEPGTLTFKAARYGDQFAIVPSNSRYASYDALKAHTEGNPLYQEFSKVRGSLSKDPSPSFWPANSLPKANA